MTDPDTPDQTPNARPAERLDRQFDALERDIPRLRRFIRYLRSNRARPVRVPLGLLLIFGGVFSFLPVLGIWMLPLGLMVLALDLPFLQGPVAALMLRTRRLATRWSRKSGR
ncbi:MAG: hypothetical protein GC146_11090 [Limimaricola sp.]|uniref:tryptophan synthase subunit beta n=1 Tax=Limimaricola sp. TaxID=2211665 RepID=UPI001D8B4C41|nr:tryptophan synthase subunit beta [Limimaricola sp.]MBI1417757.1 hypothetical protein [Limimaricola sp.]